MSSVSDYSLANQGFSAFRTELNNILGAINTTNLATSAPASLAAGSMWVDSSSAGTHTVKYYDGSDSITLFNINTSANTVDFIDSSVTTEPTWIICEKFISKPEVSVSVKMKHLSAFNWDI